MHKSMLLFTYLLAFSLSACIQDELKESSSLAKKTEMEATTEINIDQANTNPASPIDPSQSSGQEMNETSEPRPTEPTPTDPTEPTDPTDPTEPTPTDPTEPTPTDPTEPTPTDPTEPIPTPTDPTEPTSTEPTETTTNTVKSLPKISILDVQTDLGYSLSQYSSRDLSGRVTYMIGVYETRSDHNFDFHPIGSAQVEIEAQIGPIALILSSYEPTIWNLSGPGVAQIDTLIFLGYHTQEVVAEGLAVQPQSFNIDQNQYIASIYQWPAPQAECVDPLQVPFEQYEATRRICDAREVQDFIRAQINEEIDAFSGTYVATQFLIHGTAR